MNLIKEIVEGNCDKDYIHQRFVKYSKGNFGGPVISIKKAGKKIKIAGSIDYVNTLGELIANNNGTASDAGNFKVSGTIVSRRDISGELDGKIPLTKTKKRIGTFTSEVKCESDPKILAGIYREFPDAFILLSLSAPDKTVTLKTKKKVPRAGKDVDDKFFSATLPESVLDFVLGEFCFDLDMNEGDKKGFKEITVSHEYQINEIVIPEEYKNDPARARVNAKRKGTMKRVILVDSVEQRTDCDLLV